MSRGKHLLNSSKACTGQKRNPKMTWAQRLFISKPHTSTMTLTCLLKGCFIFLIISMCRAEPKLDPYRSRLTSFPKHHMIHHKCLRWNGSKGELFQTPDTCAPTAFLWGPYAPCLWHRDSKLLSELALSMEPQEQTLAMATKCVNWHSPSVHLTGLKNPMPSQPCSCL